MPRDRRLQHSATFAPRAQTAPIPVRATLAILYAGKFAWVFEASGAASLPAPAEFRRACFSATSFATPSTTSRMARMSRIASSGTLIWNSLSKAKTMLIPSSESIFSFSNVSSIEIVSTPTRCVFAITRITWAVRSSGTAPAASSIETSSLYHIVSAYGNEAAKLPAIKLCEIICPERSRDLRERALDGPSRTTAPFGHGSDRGQKKDRAREESARPALTIRCGLEGVHRTWRRGYERSPPWPRQATSHPETLYLASIGGSSRSTTFGLIDRKQQGADRIGIFPL